MKHVAALMFLVVASCSPCTCGAPPNAVECASVVDCPSGMHCLACGVCAAKEECGTLAGSCTSDDECGEAHACNAACGCVRGEE